MSQAQRMRHGPRHGEQWAETSHCRVAGVRHFGAFTALELVAPRIAAKAAPGPVRHGHRARRRLPPAPPALAVHRARRPRRPARRGARRRQRAARAASRWARRSTSPGRSARAFPARRRDAAPCSSAAASAARRCSTSPTRWRRPGAHVTAAFGFRDFRGARAAGAFDHRAPVGGHRGRQHRAARHGHRRARRARRRRRSTVVYACGPTPMIAAVQRWALGRGPARLRLARGAHGLRHRLLPRLRRRHHAGAPCASAAKDRCSPSTRCCRERRSPPRPSTCASSSAALALEHPLSTPPAPSTCSSTRAASTATTSRRSRTPPTCPRRSPRTPRTGNPPPRVTETPAGHDQRHRAREPGRRGLRRSGCPSWRALRQPVIVSVGGNSAGAVRRRRAAASRSPSPAPAAATRPHRGLRAQRLVPQRQRRPADRRRSRRHRGRRRRRPRAQTAASCSPSSRRT